MCAWRNLVLAVNPFSLHYSWKEQDSCLKTKKDPVISWECLKTTEQINSKSKPVKSNSKHHEPHSIRIQIYQMPKYQIFPGFFHIFPWFSHISSICFHIFPYFPMVFPYFFHMFPYFSIFSYGFSMVFMVFPWFSHGFPMVFPYFPMVFPWFSYGFPFPLELSSHAQGRSRAVPPRCTRPAPQRPPQGHTWHLAETIALVGWWHGGLMWVHGDFTII